MASLTEDYARRVGLQVRRCNVLVEGNTDAALLGLAAHLYRQKYAVDLLGDELAVLSAGAGEEGGVNGLNRRLQMFRSLADADLDAVGRRRFFFCGLYDNDEAGRRAVRSAQAFDSRLRLGAELFLLHPVMPLARGDPPDVVRTRFERDNVSFRRLDWEVEDLLSQGLLDAFEVEYPTAVRRTVPCADRTHRDFTRDGKHHLHLFARDHAMLDDVTEVVRLLRALRDYLRLHVDHIVC
jgi:hypothetical protein